MTTATSTPKPHRSDLPIAIATLIVAGCGRIAFDAHGDRGDAPAIKDDGPSGTMDGTADVPVAACAAQPCAGTGTAMMCNGRCVTHCTDMVLQDEAANRCSVWGGTLSPVHDQADNDCVHLVSASGSWIGYMQAMGSTTLVDNWSWLDGVSSAYTNWGVGEPMDAEGIENGQEQCAMMFPDGTWVDTGCTVTPAEVNCSR
jgi:hypothetical protein